MSIAFQVFDNEKIVLIPDHYIFTADERANRNVDILRDFAQEQDIKYFYDIVDRSNFRYLGQQNCQPVFTIVPTIRIDILRLVYCKAGSIRITKEFVISRSHKKDIADLAKCCSVQIRIHATPVRLGNSQRELATLMLVL